MGRGLSPLQRYMVTKAATVERLYYADILQEYYGWTNHGRRHYLRNAAGDLTDEWRPAFSGQKFWPDEIGRARYHATMVTLSRAAARLEQRGLVTCLVGTKYQWSGMEITPEGRREAARLAGEPTASKSS